MKKLNVLAVVVVLMTASVGWANLNWNFNDGTAQGWVNHSGNPAEVVPAGSGNYFIRHHIENGGGTFATLEISGLNAELFNTSANLNLDAWIENNPAFPHSGLIIRVLTTEGGSYSTDVGTGGSNLQFNLFTALTPETSTPLAVGNHISKIQTQLFGFSLLSNVDNVQLTVPEPATMGLLMLGGLFGLKKRS